MSYPYYKATSASLRLKSELELINFLREARTPSSLLCRQWQSKGTVSAQIDWDTFDGLRSLLGEDCKYAYRRGTLILEPFRSLMQQPYTASSVSGLKASIVAQLIDQLRPYANNGTQSGLTPSVRQNDGRQLSSRLFRTADLYISISATHNLDVHYDSPSSTGGSMIIDVVTGTSGDVEDAKEGIDDWFRYALDVRQVILVHCDQARVMQCRSLAKSHSRRPSSDKEDVGTVWRWGRDTRGRKVLLEEIKIMYYRDGYTDVPLTMIDCARDLGASIPPPQPLTVVFDWNHALNTINTV